MNSLESLRPLLRDLFGAQVAGESERKIRRATAYVDGYMRAVLDAQLTTRAELLALVREVRAEVTGPALRQSEGQELENEPDHESGVRPRRAVEAAAPRKASAA